MAMVPSTVQVQVSVTDEFMVALQKTSEELKATQEALFEERIRVIVREELAAWERKWTER
jgi:hypothetical protein